MITPGPIVRIPFEMRASFLFKLTPYFFSLEYPVAMPVMASITP
jgi:hypothetical protein